MPGLILRVFLIRGPYFLTIDTDPQPISVTAENRLCAPRVTISSRSKGELSE